LAVLRFHDHLEFCRKLHREIARLRAAQDAIDIGGGGDANRIRAFAQEAEAELPARLHTAIAGLREAGRRRKEVAA